MSHVNFKPDWGWLNWTSKIPDDLIMNTEASLSEGIDLAKKIMDDWLPVAAENLVKKTSNKLDEVTDKAVIALSTMDEAIDVAIDNTAVVTEILGTLLTRNNAIMITCSDVQEREEIYNWCKENLIDYLRFEIALDLIFIIEQDRDRVLFKLRWG
jgi:hypothetical protein